MKQSEFVRWLSQRGARFEQGTLQAIKRQLGLNQEEIMEFPAVFTAAEEGGFVVTFRDIPEAITQGDDADEAAAMAADALASAMDFYIEDGRAVPAPSPQQPGERLIALPDDLTQRIRTFNEALAK